MPRENKKIDQVQYQELIESFKKLEDDRFPVSIDHSYGKGVIDSVRVTGHNRDRVRLFKEFARDAVTLFEIPCAGCEVEKWIRLVFEHVSKLAKRSPIGGGLIFSDDIHNAAEASAIAMRRLYAREANKEDISDIAAGTVSKTNNTTEVDGEQGRNATTKSVEKIMRTGNWFYKATKNTNKPINSEQLRGKRRRHTIKGCEQPEGKNSEWLYPVDAVMAEYPYQKTLICNALTLEETAADDGG